MFSYFIPSTDASQRNVFYLFKQCKKVLKYLQKRAAIIGLQPNFPPFSWKGLRLCPVNQFLLFCKPTVVTPMAGTSCSMKERKYVSGSMATTHTSKTSFVFQAWYDYQKGPTDAHNFIQTMFVLGYQLRQRSVKSKTLTFHCVKYTDIN